MKKRLLSGIQPSGKLHLGNYLGAIRQHLESQSWSDYERFFFIANYHSLTTINDPSVLKELTFDVARTYLALGLDPHRTLLFLQSDIPEVCELTWILSTITPMGLLQRCTSYKDKVAQGISPSHGLFAYPVLQASDILIYDSHLVPVGMDQKQHIEVCRDIAEKFNHQYGPNLVVPDPMIVARVAVIPGIDGRKMSKSYGNTIDLFAPKKTLKSQVMSIVTDSKSLEEPKEPETCNVFALFQHFASEEDIRTMAEAYRQGGYGYGHAKLDLLDRIEAFLEPHRDAYEYYGAHADEVWDILRDCGAKARSIARDTVARVRDAVGLSRIMT